MSKSSKIIFEVEIPHEVETFLLRNNPGYTRHDVVSASVDAFNDFKKYDEAFDGVDIKTLKLKSGVIVSYRVDDDPLPKEHELKKAYLSLLGKYKQLIRLLSRQAQFGHEEINRINIDVEE